MSAAMIPFDAVITEHGLMAIQLAADALDDVRGGLDEEFDYEDFDARR